MIQEMYTNIHTWPINAIHPRFVHQPDPLTQSYIQGNFPTMARKVIVAAAAFAVLILSFLLPSGNNNLLLIIFHSPARDRRPVRIPLLPVKHAGVEAGLQTGGCKFYPSRLSICDLCKPRCQDEGNDSGFCDARKNCICVDCSKHGNGPSRSLRPALDAYGPT
jgi:hypothetical protein